MVKKLFIMAMKGTSVNTVQEPVCHSQRSYSGLMLKMCQPRQNRAKIGVNFMEQHEMLYSLCNCYKLVLHLIWSKKVN